MSEFIYQAFRARVIFGPGKISEVAAEAAKMAVTSALLIATKSQLSAADFIELELGSRIAGRIDGTVMHVPRQEADRAVLLARRTGCDCVIAVGGGSAIGLAKAVALDTGTPIIAVPCTYAGSEMTDIWGITESDGKITGRDEVVIPKTVIYDANLTKKYPKELAGPSGMNAIAHAVEALYAKNRNPVLTMFAEEGIRLMSTGLPAVCSGLADDNARSCALKAAFFSGVSLATATMGIHHKLCHVVGGTFRMPHAETHSVILPHAAYYNRKAAPEAMSSVAMALDAPTAAGGLFDLAMQIGAPTSLKQLGFREENLDQATDISRESPYYNPEPVDRKSVRCLLQNAFDGVRPS
ncbi:MAG: maleylacetate reductase [Pseudomonadota bacterium]|nr:maleylacetate reductase [Pseudomonadota bacterium]